MEGVLVGAAGGCDLTLSGPLLYSFCRWLWKSVCRVLGRHLTVLSVLWVQVWAVR